MKEGWICPRCGKVNAPFIGQCSCDNKKYRQNYRKPCSHDWVFDDMGSNMRVKVMSCEDSIYYIRMVNGDVEEFKKVGVAG